MAAESYAQQSTSSEVTSLCGVDHFKKGWYSENVTNDGETVTSVRIDNIVHHEQSKYQDILIFDSKAYGRILALDNAIQLSETDEFAYQEMVSFLPLNSHPNPKKVLVIGGGDGAVVREVTKHPKVESITLCEIDDRVIEVCKQYLPFAAKGFESPKLTVFIGDGAEYMKKHTGEFDVIITDSPDPKGVAVCLYQKPYYESMKQALKPGGIVACQGEIFWFEKALVKEIVTMAKTIFPVVDYGTSLVPSFPGGHIGYILCSTSPATNFRDPVHKFTPAICHKFGLRYYTSEIHRACFALPLFLAEELGLNQSLPRS